MRSLIIAFSYIANLICQSGTSATLSSDVKGSVEQNQLVSQRAAADTYTENFTTSTNAYDINGKAHTVN